jgi:hypothetical protein
MRDTIDMAREAGFTDGELAFMGDNFRRFADLVRADEREDILRMSGSQWFKSQLRYDEAIRARGNT